MQIYSILPPLHDHISGIVYRLFVLELDYIQIMDALLQPTEERELKLIHNMSRQYFIIAPCIHSHQHDQPSLPHPLPLLHSTPHQHLLQYQVLGEMLMGQLSR